MKREVNATDFLERLDILSHEDKRTQWGININYQKINMILSEAGIYDEDFDYEFLNKHFAAIAKTGDSYITKWKKSNVIPSIQYLVRIADAFDVSVEWLVGADDSIKVSEENLDLDTTNEYEIFKKYGFTYPAYQSLRKIKKQNIEIEKYLAGLNKILEYYSFTYYTDKDYFLGGAVMADDLDANEDLFLDDDGNKLTDVNGVTYYKKYHFPILWYLTDFYNLIEHEDGAFINSSVYNEVLDKIDEYECQPETREKFDPVSIGRALVMNAFPISAIDRDALILHQLIEAIKLSKGKMVKEQIDILGADNLKEQVQANTVRNKILNELNSYYKYEDFEKNLESDMIDMVKSSGKKGIVKRKFFRR